MKRETDKRPSIRSQFAREFIDVETGQRAPRLLDLFEASRVAPALDLQALNVFFRVGVFLGDTTPFRNIRFCPATLPEIRPCSDSLATATDSYIELFRNAMCRAIQRTEHRSVVVGLSGGRDSRHILLELHRQGRPPDYCWTVPTPTSPTDALIAHQLGRRLGITVKEVPAASGLRATLTSQELVNFCSMQHSWLLTARSFLQKGVVYFDGIAGDVLSESRVITPKRVRLAEKGRLEELADRLVRKGSIYLVSGSYPMPTRDDAVDTVIKELKQHFAQPNPLASFYFWNRTRRDVGEATFSLLGANGATPETPFLDDELAHYLLSLPFEVTVGTKLHTRCIHRAYPEVADIPFATAQAPPPPAAFSSILAHFAWLMRRKPGFLDRNAATIRMARYSLTRPGRQYLRTLCGAAVYRARLAHPWAQ